VRGHAAVLALVALVLVPTSATAKPSRSEVRIAVSASSSRVAPGESVRVRVAVAATGVSRVTLDERFRGPLRRVSYGGARYDRRSGSLVLRRGRAVLTVVLTARARGTITYSVAARAPVGTVPGPRAAAARVSIAVRDEPPAGGSTGSVTTAPPTTTVTTTTPGTAADFAILSMTPAQAGQTVTVVVINNGPSAASFAGRFTFANATGAAGSTDSGGYANGVWSSGAVEPGRFVSATIFTSKTGGPASITGTVTGALPDPDASNDTQSQSF
jgi:hypothetical protein